jgi:hypothetical protein
MAEKTALRTLQHARKAGQPTSQLKPHSVTYATLNRHASLLYAMHAYCQTLHHSRKNPKRRNLQLKYGAKSSAKRAVNKFHDTAQFQHTTKQKKKKKING